MARIPGLDMFYAFQKDRPPNIFDSFFPIPTNIGTMRSEEEISIKHVWELKAPLHIAKGFQETENTKKEICFVIHKETQNPNDELKDILHEIKIISSLDHDNVLKFYEAVSGTNLTDVAFVFEPVGNVLSQMMSQKIPQLYEPPIIKTIIKDLFKVLDYLHQNRIIHSNVQPENIVISPNGTIKIWNFRNAKRFDQKPKKSKVNEFRYQSLDLLLQAENYDQGVDIWGANCIFAELCLTESLFPEHGREKVIMAIFKLLGFPKQEIWKEFSSLPAAEELSNFKYYKYNMLDTYFKKHCDRPVSPYAMDLMHKCFRYNPTYRPTAEQCLMHPYFFEEQGACMREDIIALLEETAIYENIRKIRSAKSA